MSTSRIDENIKAFQSLGVLFPASFVIYRALPSVPGIKCFMCCRLFAACCVHRLFVSV